MPAGGVPSIASPGVPAVNSQRALAGASTAAPRGPRWRAAPRWRIVLFIAVASALCAALVAYGFACMLRDSPKHAWLTLLPQFVQRRRDQCDVRSRRHSDAGAGVAFGRHPRGGRLARVR